MSQVKKEVVISGKDEGSLGALLNKYEQRAREISKNLLDDATKYSQSGKQQIAYLDAQIAAIERRNKLELEYRKMGIAEKYDPNTVPAYRREGMIKKAEQAVASAEKEYKEDSLIIKYIKEVIDAIEDTAKKELISDKKNAEKEVEALDKNYDKIQAKDPDLAFKGSVQRMLLGNNKVDTEEEKQKFKFGISKGVKAANSLLSQPNEIAKSSDNFGRQTAKTEDLAAPLMKLEANDSKELLYIYLKEVKPWMNAWETFLLSGDSEEEEKQ